MQRTLNFRFSGDVVEAEPDAHPTGEAVARQLAAGLAARGWQVGAIEAWRDSGWELACARGATKLVMLLTAGGGEDGSGQIAPADVPGLIGRLRGRRASAAPADVLALATDVHALLAAAGFTDLGWVWDDYPSSAPIGPPVMPPV